ncbi:hypothetical protein DES53_107351 [Roseimicrobium gellanilyticum]|uniref:Uncharacterized protein n=1 Tax=Roseimicrobium gellanilyticum TaxID=748857 RepID=A0A366HG80_9BACT|nr:ankyrin repeat domain-containing protein [Roseimicrobium gellanilyticum]RBP41518.1 hypothetical protein DES53_107351 [Roseimicrobium gellanilyticum]
MNSQEDNRSIPELLQDLAKATTERPEGIVDWMHYGFRLRCAGMWDPAVRYGTLDRLEELALSLSGNVMVQLTPLFEQRAWMAGRHGLCTLADLLWPRISPTAQGNFLAGAAHLLEGDALSVPINDSSGIPSTEKEAEALSTWIPRRLPTVRLEAPAAAEIGACAIIAKHNSLLQCLLSRDDLPEGPVPRFSGYRDQLRFEEQLSQQSTCVLDVLLEAAVRCVRSEAVQLLLERGANPNVPCWILERNFNEWHSALSYAIKEGREKHEEEADKIIGLLLSHGATPQGLDCAGRNLPLMLAIQQRDWTLSDLLLDLGATFEGGQPYGENGYGHKGKVISEVHLTMGYSKEDLQWVEQKLSPLIPLVKPWEIPLFLQGDGQGGHIITFLHGLASDQHITELRKYEARGLGTVLTPVLLLNLINGGCYEALQHLLRDNPNLRRIMFRIRRRDPDFATQGNELMRCVPEHDGSNALLGFHPCEETALTLADGTRLHAWLDCVAPPAHSHGPISPGCFWLQTISADHRRRGKHVETLRTRRIWRAVKVPKNDYQLEDFIPLVKEVNGTFFLLGITLRSLPYGQELPEVWKESIALWKNGVAIHLIREQFVERMTAQMSMNVDAPQPVLSEKELKAYPPEFWPYLLRLSDGTIGMTPDSCRLKPGMLDLYDVWARQNKPDKNRPIDPRLLAWRMWPQIPIELRPFFHFDELFQKPSVRHDARNAYEEEMIRAAVQWNNEWMMQSLKDADL